MAEKTARGLLEESLLGLGISAPQQAIDALLRHIEMVKEWNERVNLTAITEPHAMVVKHVVDSLTALKAVAIEPGMRLLDVGTGAGFPGVPLKVMVPEAHVVLLESLQKRCKFLEAVRDEVIRPSAGSGALGLEVVWGRAEELGQRTLFRESFDVVVARAVAELRILCEYCIPFVRVGGVFVAMKGPGAVEEIDAAKKALGVLGATVKSVESIVLPENAGERTLVVIEKSRRTPGEYPRKAGTPERKPL